MVQTRGPLAGFNTNLRHADRVFHVQTEDLGIEKAQIETHIFVDGGEVLASRRTSYDAGAAQSDVIRAMKSQHKASLIAVRDGEYDEPGDRDASAAERRDVVSGSVAIVGGERLNEHTMTDQEVSHEVAAALRALLRVKR